MSKKTKKYKKQRKKQFPWLLLALGGVLFVIAGILFANRNGGDSGGTAAMIVDPAKIDYGYVAFGNNKTFAIKVTNTGTGTLRFKEKPYIEIVEGC